MEKEEWNKGKKISKPTKRVISINDYNSFANDQYFEKHGFDVEILHDPTLEEGGVKAAKSVKLEKQSDEAKGEKGKTATPSKQVNKTKADYVAELAGIRKVTVESIDPKLTIAQLKELIDEEEGGEGLTAEELDEKNKANQ